MHNYSDFKLPFHEIAKEVYNHKRLVNVKIYIEYKHEYYLQYGKSFFQNYKIDFGVYL